MGLLDKLTNNLPNTLAKKDAENTPVPRGRDSNMPLDRREQLQTRSSGIPPLKLPQMPPKHAATLMACTRTKRAYWVVFTISLSTESGWTWVYNMPAIPLTTRDRLQTKAPYTTNALSTNNDLKVGGEDWGNWNCPGCGEPQQPKEQNYYHLHVCRCGTQCCLGAGSEEERVPACPNCNRIVSREIIGLLKTIEDVHYGSDANNDHRQLPTQQNRQIEGL